RHASGVGRAHHALGELGLAEGLVARHGAVGRKLENAPVGEVRRVAVGDALRLLFHALPVDVVGLAAAGGEQEGEERVFHGATPGQARRSGPSVCRWSRVLTRSNCASRASMPSQKRSMLALSKPSTSKIGWLSRGNREKAKTQMKAVNSAKRTPISNVI